MRIPLLFLFLYITLTSFAQEKKYEATCIGFYNFENLFDTEDDPDIYDEEFTPKGKKLWSEEVYQAKLANMAKVVAMLGTNVTPDGPAILGVCEVENKRVLDDFVMQKEIADRNYQVVHHDSPDKRGIDVALIYQEKYFKVLNVKPHALGVIKSNGDTLFSRDILLVSGLLNGEPTHVMVNHWPSRSGGENKAAAYRIRAAQICKTISDSLFTDNPQANILIIGDLNDDPDSPSIKKHLAAKGKADKTPQGGLFNPLCSFYKKGNGTTAYRDSWGVFDQIIISHSLLNKTDGQMQFYKAEIFKQPWMIQAKGKYKGYPKRTFSGDVYSGGFSDHLPVLVYLVKEVKG